MSQRVAALVGELQLDDERERLTATLGPPEPHIIQRDGDRDLALNAWVIGRGEVRATPVALQVERGTTVEIFLTTNGRLLASRAAWTRRPGVAETVSRYTSMPEAMPEALYRWLVLDGKGKLGPASKEAWTEACRNVPSIVGLAVESETGGNSAAVLSRLQRSDEVIRWVHANLDGKKIPALPSEKRVSWPVRAGTSRSTIRWPLSCSFTRPSTHPRLP